MMSLSSSLAQTASTTTNASDATSASTTTTTQPPPVNKTLPGQVTPYHYNIQLFMDIYQNDTSLFKVDGNVSIFLDVKEPTWNVTLNVKELTIFRESLSLKPLTANQSVPRIVQTICDDDKEFYVLLLNEELAVGEKYELSIRFEDQLTSSPYGLSYYSYDDQAGRTHYLAISHFQPSGARQAFPCFDEPRYKATFNITLVRGVGNYTSWSNTDIIRQEPRVDKYVADVYERTPNMSTYILAFAVVNYDYMENVTSTGVMYRTIFKPDTIAEVTMSHEQGIRIFDWFNQNLHPPYPLSKLDNILIRDRLGAAMENWGLVIYKDILFNPAVNTMKAKLGNMLLLVHEVCHQWFGNLVTPKTWRWLWLSEGFAVFFEYHVIHSLHPSWRQDEMFVVDQLHPLFILDTNKRWPLVKDVPRFDHILYYKGACVVRMLRTIFGEELFLRAINAYLVKHQYGSVETSDLWTVFNEEAAKENITVNVGDLMEPWLLQMHYPVVMVTVLRSGALEVSQQLFQSNMGANVSDDGAKYGYKWDIPLTYATGSDTSSFSKNYTYNDISWLYRTQNSTLVEDVNITDPSTSGDWVLVNLHQTGYYRVNYDEVNWLALIRQLDTDHTVIPPVNRAQIIDDALSLARVGLLNESIAFRTLGFLRNDSDYISWTPAVRALDEIEGRLMNTRLYGAFKAFVLDLVTNAYKIYGLEGDIDDTPLVVYQRARIAHLACRYGVRSCLADASRLFNHWARDQDKYRPSPDIMDVVTCYGVWEGGLEAWRTVYDVYSTTTDYRYAHRLIKSLTCPKDPWLIRRVLDISTDSKKIKKFHQPAVFRNLAKSRHSLHIVWNFVKENINTLRKSIARDVIMIAAQTLTGSTFISELELLANSTSSISPSVLRSALSLFNSRKLWMEDHGPMLMQWFIDMGYGNYIL
ncbi:thyrotropin-releasing hormone-degrading ectoenzyme-like [Haliotis rubra]|uniref:thyrotropin-releasing hormone-degrading ectoenzyme-like n=1 Tax=Haliotis rubra TaxID=36100 RepID=UPI001EE54710|nr:thyrotropin-releasing hormone-degrading ectoenzyme-like [Haliotis rubra]